MHEIPVFCLLILGLLLTKESIPEEARVQNLESPAGRGSLKDRIVFFSPCLGLEESRQQAHPRFCGCLLNTYSRFLVLQGLESLSLTSSSQFIPPNSLN